MFCSIGDNQCKDSAQNNNCYQIYTCQPGADTEGHNHCKQQTERCSHAHSQNHLISILYVGYIGGKPGYQTGGAELVNIGKAKGLYIFIHCLTQILRKSGRRFRPVHTASDTKQQTEQRCQNHHCTNKIYVLQISSLYADSLINDGCHQKRDNGLHNNFSYHKYRSSDGRTFVFFYMCSKCFQHFTHASFLSSFSAALHSARSCSRLSIMICRYRLSSSVSSSDKPCSIRSSIIFICASTLA